MRRAEIWELLEFWRKGAEALALGRGEFEDEALLERVLGWLYEDVRRFRPHLFLAMHGRHVPSSLIAAAKEAGAVCALWAVDDPYEIDRSLEYALRGYDLVFTVEEAAVPVYREAGVEAFHLPLACWPEFHRPVAVPKRYFSEVLFIGSGFPSRISLLSALAGMLEGRKIKVLGQWWGGLQGANLDVEERLVSPAEAVRWTCGASVVLNPHRGAGETAYDDANSQRVPALSANARFFEVAACGAFQVCDDRPGAVALGAVTFRTLEELAEVTERALHDPVWRQAKAEELRRAVLGGHTYEHRARQIFKLVAGKEARPVSALYRGIGYYRNVNRAVLDVLGEVLSAGRARVLDVGCGSGALGAALKQVRPGTEVFGIEVNPFAAREAACVLDGVVEGDVEAVDPGFGEESFDCLVLADVLEHLRDPWGTLGRLARLLKPAGVAVATLPNVGYVGVVEGLLEGKWEYVDSGVLDSSHLRFFTRDTAVRLFERAKLKVERIEGLMWDPGDAARAAYLRASVGRSLPDAEYVQFLLVARKGGATCS